MIAAVVLAAGRSQRMGQPKMVLPWGGRTVIGTVVAALDRAGLQKIIVVTGGDRQIVESALQRVPLHAELIAVFNPQYADGDMIHSVSCGLRVLREQVRAAMIVLGDQPQIEHEVVTALIKAFSESRKKIIIPSYKMRRGHPWLIDRSLWPVLVRQENNATMRDFLDAHQDDIEYIVVNTPSVIQDLDTPADYKQQTGRQLRDDEE